MINRTQRISIRQYGMVLKPINFEQIVAETVKKEDEVEHARRYVPMQIPEMKYPSVKFRPTSLKALFAEIKGCLP